MGLTVSVLLAGLPRAVTHETAPGVGLFLEEFAHLQRTFSGGRMAAAPADADLNFDTRVDLSDYQLWLKARTDPADDAAGRSLQRASVPLVRILLWLFIMLLVVLSAAEANEDNRHPQQA